MAYAVHFVASTKNNYLTLGHSMILSRNSDPQEVLNHLKSLLDYYEEQYNTTFNQFTFMRYREIGSSKEIATLIHDSPLNTKYVKQPWGEIKTVAAIPFPHLDYRAVLNMVKNIHFQPQYLLDFFNPYYTNVQVVGWGEKMLTLQLSENEFLQFTDLTLYKSIGTYTNTIENITIHFQDSFNHDRLIIHRSVNNITVVINQGDLQGFPLQYYNQFANPKRLIHSSKQISDKFIIQKNQIITADIEALIVDRKYNIPYAAEFFGYDSNEQPVTKQFKWQDYNLNSFELLKTFWIELIRFADGRTVYFHNWAGYDAYHTLNPLIHVAEELNLIIKPTLRKGKIIHVCVYSKDKKLLFDIKDSILIMPTSLSNLAKSFKLPILKEHFPHYWDVTKISPDANYIGAWPEYQYFEPKRTSLNDYENLLLKEPIFNYMEHTMKYLHLDCKLLHDILYLFFSELKEEFKMNPLTNLSIPGIAFKAWKIHQLPTLEESQNFKLLDLSGNYDNFFRDTYCGGIVDVYKPYIKDGYYYDVNSLYPTAMLKSMPVGEPIFCIPTIEEFINSDWFGFINCSITTPENIQIPILAVRREGKLISPVGTFNGTFYSEELRFALENGYKINSIGYGYKFTKCENLFTDYISNLSRMKIQAEVNQQPAKRFLSKLMMNSTYGRFGMHPNEGISTIVNSLDAKIIASAFPIIRVVPFTNGFELIEYHPIPHPDAVTKGLISKKDLDRFIQNPMDFNQTNVPIAAAVTSHSRMIINKYKLECLKLGIDVIYSDTDSLVVNKPIPIEWLHPTEFGKFKLEHRIKEAYFVAPKLYYLECVDSEGKIYEVSKNKGYSGKLTKDQILTLYKGDTLDLNRHVWHREWKTHEVWFDMDANVTLTAPFTKRDKIIEDGNWISTKPLNFNEDIIKPIHITDPIQYKVQRKSNTFWLIQNEIRLRQMKKGYKHSLKTRQTKQARPS